MGTYVHYRPTCILLLLLRKEFNMYYRSRPTYTYYRHAYRITYANFLYPQTRVPGVSLCPVPVTLYSDYTVLTRRSDISQSSVGSTKNADKFGKLFFFLHNMEMLRRPYGDCDVSTASARSECGVTLSITCRPTVHVCV